MVAPMSWSDAVEVLRTVYQQGGWSLADQQRLDTARDIIINQVARYCQKNTDGLGDWLVMEQWGAYRTPREIAAEWDIIASREAH